MKTLTQYFLILAFLLSAAGAPPTPAPDEISSITAWGDSITSGLGAARQYETYPAQLALLTGGLVFNRGYSGRTSTYIADQMLVEPSRHGDITIIWVGRNNYWQFDTIKKDVARMVESLDTDNYIVVSILKGEYTTEYCGGINGKRIDQINNSLANEYGIHWLDMNAYLVSQYNPGNSTDVTDHARGVIPSSLRAHTDLIHPNSDGYFLTAQKIYQKLISMQQLKEQHPEIYYYTHPQDSPGIRIAATSMLPSSTDQITPTSTNTSPPPTPTAVSTATAVSKPQDAARQMWQQQFPLTPYP